MIVDICSHCEVVHVKQKPTEALTGQLSLFSDIHKWFMSLTNTKQ